MEREVRGITLFSVLWEIMIFGGFISANEFAIKNLIQAYEWLFFHSDFAVGAFIWHFPTIPIYKSQVSLGICNQHSAGLNVGLLRLFFLRERTDIMGVCFIAKSLFQKGKRKWE